MATTGLRPVLLSTPEPLAYGLGLGGCALARSRRRALATLALATAVLTRESAALLAVAAATDATLRRQWKSAISYLAVPIAVFLAWHNAVAHLLAAATHPYERQLVPFGLLHADKLNVTLALGALALCAWSAWYWRRVPLVSAIAALLGAAVLTLAPRNLGPLALTRTMAPAEAVALAALMDRLRMQRNSGPPRRSAASTE